MRLPSIENVRWYGMVVGLAAVLVLLAILQYRSGEAVSQATSEQMRASLEGSLLDVRQGLERELTPLCREMESDSDNSNDSPDYAARFERWRNATAHPGLVEQVFVWRERNTPHSQLYQLSSKRTSFEPAEWSPELTRLRDQVLKGNSALGVPPIGDSNREPAPNDSHRQFGGGRSSGPQNHDAAMQGHPEPPPDRISGPDNSPPPDSQDENGRFPNRAQPFRPRGNDDHRHRLDDNPPNYPWMIDQSIPALIHPTIEFTKRGTLDPGQPSLGFILIVLNRDVLTRHILPELVQRYFGNKDQSAYEVAILDRKQPISELYATSVGFGLRANSAPDEQLNLFGRPDLIQASQTSRSGGLYLPLRASAPQKSAVAVVPEGSNQTYHDEGLFRIDPIYYPGNEQGWEIIATHRQGSVDAAVASLWRQNLVFNFAVLLVLAATMGMIIAATVRGRRFARLQMDFVANVSHELRTPLTGIISAAQNIADGVVDDKQRISRYGKAIVSEAEQLSGLVEQILLFSATEKDLHRYRLQPINVVEVIDVSVTNLSTLIQTAGVTIERKFESNLPEVSADPKALSQCLQNLISNAIKYGGESRWLAIHASLEKNSKNSQEVRISVTDKGIGIGAEDLCHVFDPFYRAAEVTAAQIRGSGLGLALAKRITEAMDGQLTVESEPGKGSTFTVHLPVQFPA
jgi:signal transduction histidine kinase